MKEFTDILYEVNDPAAVITLNRPEQLNAFTLHTLNEIKSAVNAAVKDPRVVGIIVTGAGKAFSAGLDMTFLAEQVADADAPSSPSDDELPGIFSYFLETPKPIIAAVNGVAAGGGLILALLSDLRFASAQAKLTTVFLKRGLIAEQGSSWLLPRLVGVSKALDLLWMSDKLSADEALNIGLVDRVTEPDELLNVAFDYILKLSQVSAPKGIAASKRLVYEHLGKSYQEALIEAEEVQGGFVGAPDATEGVQAFIDRRPPKFERIGDK